jgi:Flp pilus assembly CpaF family ATPase
MTVPVPEELLERLRIAVATEVAKRAATMRLSSGKALDGDDQQMLAQELLNRELEAHATECLARGEPVLSPDDEQVVASAVLERIFQLKRLQPLIDDERIQNIVANGFDEVWLEYEDGTKVPGPPIAASNADMIELLREIGRRYGLSEREFNPSRPSLNLQLPDGSRLFAVAWVCDRPCLAIRRHRLMKVTLDDLVGLGTIDQGLRDFLAAAVRARKQLIIAGATGAGKTTLLRALASEIPPSERLITIETELELGLDRFKELHEDCVALEAREANVEHVGAVTAADLVRMSLRMNPDRCLVGEVRGDEVIPMLNAMSQGNEGSMCTIHADSSATVFNKLALYAMQAPERLPIEATALLASAAIDLVVFVTKKGNDRYVSSVRQVVGASGPTVITNELFEPGPNGRAVPAMAVPVELAEELADAGWDPTSHRWNAGWAR